MESCDIKTFPKHENKLPNANMAGLGGKLFDIAESSDSRSNANDCWEKERADVARDIVVLRILM